MKAEKAVAVAVAAGGADDWRCRKHPAARSGGGVCPHCLRDRLLRLCPNCAHVRPCPCTSCASPSSSSASGEAAVGRVHTLIEREHRIARSRSVAASSSLAAAASAASAATAGAVGGRRKARVWGWPPFWKPAARDGVAGAEEDEEEGMGLARSSSVSATAVEAKAAAAAAKARWGWHFPSPLKAFRHRRSSASMPERG